MNGVFIGKQRIGSILGPCAGEPRKTKWYAFARGGLKQGFPTKWEAAEWLYDWAQSEGKDAFGNPLEPQP